MTIEDDRSKLVENVSVAQYLVSFPEAVRDVRKPARKWTIEAGVAL